MTVGIEIQGIKYLGRQADCCVVFICQKMAICFSTCITTFSLIVTIFCLNDVTTKYDEYKKHLSKTNIRVIPRFHFVVS